MVDTSTIEIKINGEEHIVHTGTSILKACQDLGIEIPTLCYLDGISEEAACSLCMVEVKGAKSLVRACVTKVVSGMEVSTNTARARKARRMNIELLLASHPQDCLTCERNQNCDLRKLAYEMGVKDIRFAKSSDHKFAWDTSSPSLVRDPNKCVLCRRCIETCSFVQAVSAIDVTGRGKSSKVSTFMERGLGNVDCVNCGQCLLVCPTGAIVEKDEIEDTWHSLHDPEKVVVVQTAPAVRAAIGEEFGMPAGSLVTGKMAAGLRRLGFNKVFDTQFTADLTIMEEGHEL
ncbi:MAG: [Fe-Fe] hydrogenase large subunit C-terminal domain-containing protein, partial [Candidatus Margulisiibacteriota bacterium]